MLFLGTDPRIHRRTPQRVAGLRVLSGDGARPSCRSWKGSHGSGGRLVECGHCPSRWATGTGEVSVAIAVSSPHRQAAFEAGQWLIDTLKQVVPSGSRNMGGRDREWVHPGLRPPQPRSKPVR